MRTLLSVPACLAALLIAVPTAAAVPLVGTDGTWVYRFDSASPGTVTGVPVTGLAPFETLLDIDYRPADDAVAAVEQPFRGTHGHTWPYPERGPAELFRPVGPAGTVRPPGASSDQMRWTIVPVPRPPPQHIVTSPISLSERSSS